jgi:putative hemolysin
MSSSAYIGEKLGGRQEAISGVDFEQAIELTVGHTATREEVNIFKGILKFGNITVRQIMRTRLDVSGIPHELTFPEVQRLAIESGYSRMPVYRENLDRIAGMIHTKDFLPHTEDDTFDWHTLIRPAYFVHEGKRIHFAVVVDEFGGTSGIVTLEDIMEEIIGDIRDEFDEDDADFRKLDDHQYIFDGKMLINDMCRAIGVPADVFDEARGESDSIAGLVLEISGRFPAVNETVSWKQYDFTVLELDRMRITRVKLTINEPQRADD